MIAFGVIPYFGMELIADWRMSKEGEYPAGDIPYSAWRMILSISEDSGILTVIPSDDPRSGKVRGLHSSEHWGRKDLNASWVPFLITQEWRWKSTESDDEKMRSVGDACHPGKNVKETPTTVVLVVSSNLAIGDVITDWVSGDWVGDLF